MTGQLGFYFHLKADGEINGGQILFGEGDSIQGYRWNETADRGFVLLPEGIRPGTNMTVLGDRFEIRSSDATLEGTPVVPRYSLYGGRIWSIYHMQSNGTDYYFQSMFPSPFGTGYVQGDVLIEEGDFSFWLIRQSIMSLGTWIDGPGGRCPISLDEDVPPVDSGLSFG